MQHLEVSCAVRRFFKSLGFKGLTDIVVPTVILMHRSRRTSRWGIFLYVLATADDFTERVATLS